MLLPPLLFAGFGDEDRDDSLFLMLPPYRPSSQEEV